MRTTFLLFLCIQLATAFSYADSPARPNILYFYVDDMGWGSLGPNAQAARKAAGLPHVKTPHLDELAAKGVNFTRAYGCTVCSPARSSQQTGFHQGHTFADRNDPDNARKAIRTDDITMGDVLSKAGYATGYWGKWGYGGSKDMQTPQSTTYRPCRLLMAINTSSQNCTTSGHIPFSNRRSGVRPLLPMQRADLS